VRRYLVLAIVLHVGIMLALAALPKPVAAIEAPSLELYDVAEVTATHDETPVPPAPSEPSEPGTRTRNALATSAGEVRPSGMINGAAHSSAGEVLTAQPSPTPEAPGGWSFSSTGGASASAIGLDGKNVILGQNIVPPAASGELAGGDGAPVDPAKRMAAIMKADLHADDVAKGLGSSGPVISNLESVVRRSMIPDESKARFVVDTDAAGAVISVRTSGGKGDESAWNALCADLKTSLASTKFKVPSGWNGIRMVVDLDSHMARPSGNTSAAKLGHGGIEGDLSDIGAAAHRVVHARVAQELPL
jgi:hypothetical protein